MLPAPLPPLPLLLSIPLFAWYGHYLGGMRMSFFSAHILIFCTKYHSSSPLPWHRGCMEECCLSSAVMSHFHLSYLVISSTSLPLCLACLLVSHIPFHVCLLASQVVEDLFLERPISGLAHG